MTTIIHHNGQISYDSRVTRDNIIHDDNFNKRLSEKGAEFFIAGSTSQSRALADAYHRGIFGYVCEDSMTEAIIWHKKKLFIAYFDGDSIELDEEPITNTFAIGSGGDFAVMAIKQGSPDAASAVAAAMKMDIYTGGRIRTFNLKA